MLITLAWMSVQASATLALALAVILLPWAILQARRSIIKRRTTMGSVRVVSGSSAGQSTNRSRLPLQRDLSIRGKSKVENVYNTSYEPLPAEVDWLGVFRETAGQGTCFVHPPGKAATFRADRKDRDRR